MPEYNVFTLFCVGWTLEQVDRLEMAVLASRGVTGSGSCTDLKLVGSKRNFLTILGRLGAKGLLNISGSGDKCLLTAICAGLCQDELKKSYKGKIKRYNKERKYASSYRKFHSRIKVSGHISAFAPLSSSHAESPGCWTGSKC